MKAVLLVSHGSRSPQSRQEIDALASRLAAQAAAPTGSRSARPGTDGIQIFESAFLEIEKPSIPEGLAACVRRGATRITVLLNFLNSGRHVTEDIPRLVREFELVHPNVRCAITPCLGLAEGIDALYFDLIRKTGDEKSDHHPRN